MLPGRFVKGYLHFLLRHRGVIAIALGLSTLFFTWAISLILLFRPPAARQPATTLVQAPAAEPITPPETPVA